MKNLGLLCLTGLTIFLAQPFAENLSPPSLNLINQTGLSFTVLEVAPAGPQANASEPWGDNLLLQEWNDGEQITLNLPPAAYWDFHAEGTFPSGDPLELDFLCPADHSGKTGILLYRLGRGEVQLLDTTSPRL